MFTPTAASVTDTRVDRLLTRTATLLVVLRHQADYIHLQEAGHVQSVRWTSCPHARCRRLQELVRHSGRFHPDAISLTWPSA